jgi:hypothetical protein
VLTFQKKEVCTPLLRLKIFLFSKTYSLVLKSLVSRVAMSSNAEAKCACVCVCDKFKKNEGRYGSLSLSRSRRSPSLSFSPLFFFFFFFKVLLNWLTNTISLFL